MAFRITADCSGCGHCVKHCPVEAIVGRRGLAHRVEPTRCIDCGACGAACAEGVVLDERGAPCVFGLDAPVGRRPWIDAARCDGCGACASACPVDALEILTGPRIAALRPERCTGCTWCELECDAGAITPGRAPPPRGIALR